MSKRYTDIMAQITTLNDEVCAIWDKAGDDELPNEQFQQVVTNNKKIEELEHEAKEIQEKEEQQAAARAQAEQRRASLQQPTNSLPAPRVEPKDRKDAPPPAVSIGEAVLNDPAFKEWLAKNKFGGAMTKAAFGASPRVTVPGGMKTLITGLSDTTGGALIPVSQFFGAPVTGTYRRPLVIRDLITVGGTETDAIEYVLEGTPTNNAAPVAEATATSGSSGSKPESAIALSKATTTVKTVAHWVPVTRQALGDAKQLRMYIEDFLRYGLNEELEDQIVTGDGTGDNFTGILNTSNTLTQAWATDILTTLRKARTKVRVSGRAQPTAFGLHPNDWETIDLLQDNEGRYYYGGPSVLGTPRLWGLPVVESEAITEGVGICADWRRAVLFDREQVQILVSDSHSDFFTRNLVAILGELRAAFFIIRPQAFCEVDLTA